mgnify:FL=1|jgi:hypothetical protein
MGMIAEIFRNDMFKDCSNGGVSSNFTSVTVVNVEGPFEPTVGRPAVELVEGYVKGTCFVRPVYLGTERPMMGGTYVATSDSRFRQKVREITGGEFSGAVPFHDRIEF